MEKRMKQARSLLGDLAALQAKSAATEKRLQAQAEKRLAEVQAEIDRLRTGIEAAPEKEQERYLELIRERGVLKKVIAT